MNDTRTKRCPKCSEVKDVDLFYRSKTAKDNCSSYCKKCQNLRSTSYARNNKDKIPTTGYSLRTRYGITSADYEELLKAQDYKCAICEREQCKTGRNFAVDHNHETNKIRGLLCSNCNVGIGNLKDSIPLLRKSIDYLEKYAI